jgi:hypothetical protein
MQRVLQTKLAVTNAIGSSRVIANMVTGSTKEQLEDMIQAADKTITYREVPMLVRSVFCILYLNSPHTCNPVKHCTLYSTIV